MTPDNLLQLLLSYLNLFDIIDTVPAARRALLSIFMNSVTLSFACPAFLCLPGIPFHYFFVGQSLDTCSDLSLHAITSSSRLVDFICKLCDLTLNFEI
jgi:hypothetical protein